MTLHDLSDTRTNVFQLSQKLLPQSPLRLLAFCAPHERANLFDLTLAQYSPWLSIPASVATCTNILAPSSLILPIIVSAMFWTAGEFSFLKSSVLHQPEGTFLTTTKGFVVASALQDDVGLVLRALGHITSQVTFS